MATPERHKRRHYAMDGVEVDVAASDDAYYWNRTMNKTHWKLPANVHPAWSQKCPGRGSAPYFIHISRGKRLERIPENHEMASTKKTAAETLCKLPTTASANAHQKSIPEPQTFLKNSRL